MSFRAKTTNIVFASGHLTMKFRHGVAAKFLEVAGHQDHG